MHGGPPEQPASDEEDEPDDDDEHASRESDTRATTNRMKGLLNMALIRVDRIMDLHPLL
jgi:hypothetical protein